MSVANSTHTKEELMHVITEVLKTLWMLRIPRSNTDSHHTSLST
jgi:hypothetical protein